MSPDFVATPENRVVFEEGVGPIPVRITYENGLPVRTQMTQPLPEFGPVFDDRDTIAAMLSFRRPSSGSRDRRTSSLETSCRNCSPLCFRS